MKTLIYNCDNCNNEIKSIQMPGHSLRGVFQFEIKTPVGVTIYFDFCESCYIEFIKSTGGRNVSTN